MKSSDSLVNTLATAFTDTSKFFRTSLSMHMVPVIFALILIALANQGNLQNEADATAKDVHVDNEAAVSSAQLADNTSTINRSSIVTGLIMVSGSNITQAMAIYKGSRLLKAAVSGR